jgi:hypothetical protein
MDEDEFRILTRDAFSFLENQLQFKVSSERLTEDLLTVTYTGAQSFVVVKLDEREPQIFVDIGRIRNGKIPPYPIFVENETELDRFDLLDLIGVRSGQAPDDDGRLSGVFRKREIRRKLGQFAEELRRKGMDVLDGDFTVFPMLEDRVRDRTKLG